MAALLYALQADADQPKIGSGGVLSVVVENDGSAGQDRHYTNGLRASWLSPDAPPQWLNGLARRLPFFSDGRRIRVEYAAGQSIFTPTDISAVTPDPNDRPYAGWLYGSIGLIAHGDAHLDQLRLTAGVVGPASGARRVQKIIHEVTGSRDPRGWGFQLRNEPGVVLTYQHTWRAKAVRADGIGAFDVLPHAGAAVGNVLTYANGGVTLRFGPTLPADYGPPRIEPSLPGSSYFSPSTGFEWYGFAGADVRLVARNIFLDGNTFRDSPSVDRESVTGDLQAGVVFTYRATRLSFTHVLRSREFKGQGRRDQFGALTFSTVF